MQSQGPIRDHAPVIARRDRHRALLALLALGLGARFDLGVFSPASLADVPVLAQVAGLLGLFGKLGKLGNEYSVLTANAYNPWALVGTPSLANVAASGSGARVAPCRPPRNAEPLGAGPPCLARGPVAAGEATRHHGHVTDPCPAPPRPAAPLDEASLALAVDRLAARDPVLAASVARHGHPPLWARAPGFPTLVHIILEQQVSLASARAAFDRLAVARAPLAPATFLELGDGELLEIGFSRQKARYGRELARAVLDGRLDLDALGSLDDEAVDAQLTAIPGIGPWTATIYRLMVLGRADAWPAHDLALAQAVADLQGRSARPDAREMAALADSWRPWRAVAARILWHHYLSERARRAG